MKTFKQLALELAKLEGKKKQVDIAQIRELLASLKKLVKQDPEWLVPVLKK
jgi:hypothetical protein